MLDNLRRDLRYAIRTLRKNPGFTAIVLLTLALGIGGNTAVFSVISAIFLRPLPGITDPERLVSLYRIQNAEPFDDMGYPDYRDYRDQNHSFLGIAAHIPHAISFNDGSSELTLGDLVTPNYFDVLGVRPEAGRLLVEDDEDAAVISYQLWQRKFGGDPQTIGARIKLNGYPFIIAGITEQGFRGTITSLPLDLWVPLRTQPRLIPRLSRGILENRAAGWLELFGRLSPGVSVSLASSDIKTIAAQLARAYPMTNGKRTADISPGVGMYPDDKAEVSGLLALLSGAVALLLLIACANVAGMLLLRVMGRTREMAIRLATGATRRRILSQLLTEGLVLALISGAAGVLLAYWATQAIIAAGSGTAASLIRHAGASIDGKVLAFTLIASVATGVLVALVPAMQTMKVDLAQSLKNGLPGSGFERSLLRLVLVAGQVALSLVLLSGAGLLLRGLYRIVTSDPGFDINNVAIATLDLTLQQYSEDRGQQFYRQLLDRLRRTQGVVSASIASSVPPTEWPGAVSVFHPGEEPPQDALQGHEFEIGTRTNINHVSPGYFRTLRIPLLQGRDFTDSDRSSSQAVVIVSRKLARQMWPGENPIGKQIAYPRWQGPRRPPFEVIGVAADVQHLALTRDPPLMLYVPISQEYGGAMRILIRTATDAHAGLVTIQHVVAATGKSVAAYFPQTGAEHSADSLWQQRMAATWIAAFSAMALLLAAIGLYAVIAQSVTQRTREVGIRIALGATHGAVAALILKQGIRVAAGGIAVGIPASFAFDEIIRGRVAGIGRSDPFTLTAIVVLLLAVMLAACWIPANRAARFDPLEALRCE